MPMHWIPEPPAGTPVCLAFDGSEVSDFTVIKGETQDGLLFTPRWASGTGGGTIWDPTGFGGRIPKANVLEAARDLFGRFKVERSYWDPPYWATEIDELAAELGEEKVIKWPTYRPLPMHAAAERFLADIQSGRLKHDGCPITNVHMANARMSTRKDQRYMLEKPDAARKIDAAVTSVLVHEAAADARAAGWGSKTESKLIFFTK